MPRRIFVLVVIALCAASAAEAQYGGGGMGGGMGGGGMGGGGGGHRGGRRNQDQPAPATPDPSQAKPATPQTALGKVQITGVVTRIDAAHQRLTIAYEPVDALNWPAGTMPFEVEKPALMDGLSVGEKVRFHVESQQITALAPIGPSGSPGTQ